MYYLILFGPPGSGKGTQSDNIASKYGLCHLSTGEMLRQEIAEGTDLGMQTKSIIASGKLVPDEIVITLIERKLELLGKDFKGFIFDGFPRTTAQAIALDNLLKVHLASIDQVIFLKVPQSELFKRIAIRRRHSNRSDDADVNIIKERIREYRSKTKPLLDYYRNQKKYHFVLGMGTVDEIFGRLCQKIEEYRGQ
jgi:adenylate kinase